MQIAKQITPEEVNLAIRQRFNIKDYDKGDCQSEFKAKTRQ